MMNLTPSGRTPQEYDLEDKSIVKQQANSNKSDQWRAAIAAFMSKVTSTIGCQSIPLSWQPVLNGNSNYIACTDGKAIYLEDRHERIIDLLKNARQPMFLVCVSDQARRLNENDRKPVRSTENGFSARRYRAS